MISPGSAPRVPLRGSRATCVAIGLVALCVCRTATAESSLSNDGNAVSYEPPPALRRDGFTLGLVQHFGLAHVSGYPNRIAAIGDPALRSSTGAEFGQSGGLWIGGALRDWLTVGVGLTAAGTFADDPAGATSTFVLHLEAFPAFQRGGLYRDLGISLEVGTGVGGITRGDDTLAEGGSLAHFGGSVFFEPLRFWQFSSGPSLFYSHQFSQTLTAHFVGLGWRLVFYGVQPR